MIVLLLLALILVVLYLTIMSGEQFTQPWDRTNCKISCFQRGQNIPWIGKIDGAWNDPAAHSEATFDVAGCMAKCDQPY